MSKVVNAINEWQRRFDNVLRKIHARSSQSTSEEIESNITCVVREVREAREGKRYT